MPKTLLKQWFRLSKLSRILQAMNDNTSPLLIKLRETYEAIQPAHKRLSSAPPPNGISQIAVKKPKAISPDIYTLLVLYYTQLDSIEWVSLGATREGSLLNANAVPYTTLLVDGESVHFACLLSKPTQERGCPRALIA